MGAPRRYEYDTVAERKAASNKRTKLAKEQAIREAALTPQRLDCRCITASDDRPGSGAVRSLDGRCGRCGKRVTD